MANPRILSLAAGCLGLSSAALSGAEPRVSGAVGAVTDYLYRGVTQSHGQPAIQAAVQLEGLSGWNTGVWASTVDLNRDGSRGYEVDLHATHTWPLDADWSAAVGLTHREYGGEPQALDYDHDELNASLSWQERVTVSVAYSPNATFYFRGPVHGETYAWELSLQQPLNAQWSLFAGAGLYDLTDLAHEKYTYWSAGVTFAWAALQFDLVHVGSSDDASYLREDYGGSRWTGALTVRF
jgi:uncharacterized protein (TIGR02001 family)